VHVIAPELGLTPRCPVCLLPDSHTCYPTAASGRLGFGLGRAIHHVLATRPLYQKKPRQMRIRLKCAKSRVTPKDFRSCISRYHLAAGGNVTRSEFAGSNTSHAG